jgi:hypothetical protein
VGRARRNWDTAPSARPAGPKWVEFRRRLFSGDVWGPTPLCHLCGHPGASEVQHQFAPDTRPDLAWAVSNMRPAHGGGARRCPTCGLACNALAASNLAIRGADGIPLPFTDAFIKAAQERRKARNARGMTETAGKPAKPAGTAAKRRQEPAGAPALPYYGPCEHFPPEYSGLPGRCFLCMGPRRLALPAIALPEPVSVPATTGPCDFCGSASSHRDGCPAIYAE